MQLDIQHAKAEEIEYQRLRSLEAAIQEENAEAAAEKDNVETEPPENDEERQRLEKERIARAKAKRERDAEIERLVRKRMEMEENRRKEQAVQAKLREMGVCCQGFQWIKQQDGYRCAGGSHWVSNSQLGQ